MLTKDISKIAATFKTTEKMPLLFLGHGNPMNAILENEYTLAWRQIGKSLPKPNAIICISAHWETNGTYVTAMENPKTIHDFYGFPKILFDVNYPAKGNVELANETKKNILNTSVELDYEWGFDHGSWSVLKHLYPEADVPVIQLSLNRTQSPQWHYQLAKELAFLRKKGVLIIGSGNIVHNLQMINWQTKNPSDWALEANEKIKQLISENNHAALIDYKKLGSALQLAIPTPEHFLPLLYILGLKNEDESEFFFNDKTDLGSISMTSLQLG